MFQLPGSVRLHRVFQTLIVFLVVAWLSYTFFTYDPQGKHSLLHHQIPFLERPRHPIDDLREAAQFEYESLVAKQSYTLEAAEQAYLHRRGRRPPPGYDRWFRFAQEHNAVLVEEFFDRIYDDLNPFWAVPPKDMRTYASDWYFRISIRNGNVTKRSDVERPWMNLWGDLVGRVADQLPDMDLAINEMDESRIVAPWESINDYIAQEQAKRHIIPPEKIRSEFNETTVPDSDTPRVDYKLAGEGPYWAHYVKGCDPKSPARSYSAEVDFTQSPPLSSAIPERSHYGYVHNWTHVKSPCEHPQLQGLHGTFVEPISLSNSAVLFPLFGGSKLPMNNEILLPPAMYWTDDPFYSGGDEHGGSWTGKIDRLIWRGAASGGRNRQDNWTRFQRHRFVAMMNGTLVRNIEDGKVTPPNFVMPDRDAYDLPREEHHALGPWLDRVGDAAFVHLLCFPDPNPPFCSYTDGWFSVAETKPMKEQYNYKYLPDIDGNSFSGRYRGFLASTSMPIKATIYDEWHDSRLVPWIHFVPMHNTFTDLYGIMEYFLGSDTKAGHDDIAHAIAMEGKSWAERVLRKEDMVIYVFRLLLEYARLLDDNRDTLGWASTLAHERGG